MGSGDVLIGVEAIGINYAEVLSRKGLYGWAPDRPYVPGMEVAGRIEAIGPDVMGRSVGERVLCGMQYGGYAERVAVRANRALPAPDHFSMDEAAAFGVNFMTAWVALTEMARLRPDDRVAITAVVVRGKQNEPQRLDHARDLVEHESKENHGRAALQKDGYVANLLPKVR